MIHQIFSNEQFSRRIFFSTIIFPDNFTNFQVLQITTDMRDRQKIAHCDRALIENARAHFS